MLFALNEMKQTRLQEVLDEGAAAQTSGESSVARGRADSRRAVCWALGVGRERFLCALPRPVPATRHSQTGQDTLDGRNTASPASLPHRAEAIRMLCGIPGLRKALTHPSEGRK